MTNIRRPIHIQSRPNSLALTSSTRQAGSCSLNKTPLSPLDDSLPSQILPYLFVGNQGQTNKDTLNRLNISYILSLGLSPLISINQSTTPSSKHPPASVPINTITNATIKTTTTTISPTTAPAANNTTTSTTTTSIATTPACLRASSDSRENEGVTTVRSIKCKCINIADNCEQSLAKFFDEAHQFIDEARKKKCNILVHCLAGISRSPTIAISYLMRANSLPLQDAYNLVKKCRPQTDPNIGFLGQLISFEKTLREHTTKQVGQTENTGAIESHNDIVKHVFV